MIEGLGRLVAWLTSVVTALTLPGLAHVQAVPTSIPADCSADVSRALNEWIASVPDGSTIVFPPNACYRVEQPVNIVDRSGLTFDGNGATFRATTPGDSGRKQWQLIGGSNLTLRNLTAVGVNPTPHYVSDFEWQHNYSIQGVDGVVLDRVTGLNAYGDFVSIDPDRRREPAVPSRNVTVKGSTFRVAGRQGISCTFCDGLTVEGNVLDGVGQSAIDWEIEHVDWHGRNLRVSDNRIGHVHFAFLASTGASADISNVFVTRNTMERFPDTCIPPVYLVTPPHGLSTNFVFEGNQLRSLSDGVFASGAKGVTVRGNTVEVKDTAGCGSTAGVRVAKSQGGAVVGNTFRGTNPTFQADPESGGFAVCGNTTDKAAAEPAGCGVVPPRAP